MLKKLRNDKGRADFRTIFWTFFIFAAFYCGYLIVPPTIAHQMIKKEAEAEARNAHIHSDNEIRVKIIDRAMAWHIPISKRAINIKRYTADTMYVAIQFDYAVDIEFIGGYERTFYYEVDVVKPVIRRTY